jgi:hypothetical protein
MSFTHRRTAAGEKTRSIHPSRKMTGLILSIACNAPSENRPSGKDAEGDGKFNVQMAYDEVDRRLFGNAAPDRLVGRSRSVSANVAPTVSDNAGSRMASCSRGRQEPQHL